MKLKTDNKDFYRDSENGALINEDQSGLALYKAQRERIFKDGERDSKIENLESELSEIKSLLKEILQKASN